MKVKANPRSLEIEYAIRDVIAPATALEKQGHRILKLNIGDPNKYDFDTPAFIKDSVAEALTKGLNGYAPSPGIPELMLAIVGDERSRGNDVEAKDITVTAGVTEALQLIFYASLSPKDEILIPGPSYPPYITYSKMIGAKPVAYRTIEDQDWIPDIDDIRRKITKRTKAISIINPNNPTGAMYTEKEIKQIGDLAAEHGGCFLLSDEIYNLMTFEAEPPSTARVCPDLPVITMNGISKNYLAPGWRIGYLAIRDPRDQLVDIRDGIERQARARLCANSICQYAFYKALTGPKDHIKQTNDKLRRRRDLSYERINEIDGLSVRKPGGAFYMFPRIDCMERGPWKDDREFVLDLLREEKVLTVFGSGFGVEYGSGHFRIVILPEEETLEKAYAGMERFIRKRVKS
jgi:alanine-synthesizing transaminase